MNGPLAGLGSIAFKEFLHIRRDRTTLIFALITPLLQLLIFGFAINYNVRNIRTVVVDQDRSRESREYLAAVKNMQYLEVIGSLDSPFEATDVLRRGDARVAIIIPPDFARRLGTANPPQVRVMLDGSDSQVANPARLAILGLSTTPSKTIEPRMEVLYNPSSLTANYTIPGLVGVILQLVTVTLTAFSLVRERESGTLDQLMVTPVSTLGLMFGKLIPYALLASIEFLGVLVLAKIVFGVAVVGSIPLLAGLAVLFIVAALALGLLISTVAENQAQALQYALLTLLPSILLSGYIAPRETLPGPLAILSLAFPVTHFITISRGIMVRGAGFNDLLPSVIALASIAIVLIAFAAGRFRKTVA